MIAWMLYSVVVSAVVAGAARAADSLARLCGYRIRWIWLGALALAAFLSVSSAVRRVEPRTPFTVVATVRDVATVARTSSTWTQALRAAITDIERTLDGSLAAAALEAIDRAATPLATNYAMIVWVIASLGLASIFGAIIYRFQRARAQWPMSRVQDVPVRVSPTVGPIVVGLVRPEIVVPRWLLHRPVAEQRLAVAHEQEHLRARDPLLLGSGWLAVILAPWNPAAWYMLSRLRLAIELDCDARVLRRGAAPRAYGSLLIEVAQNAAPLTLSALGFADESSQLYQRILALRGPAASFARTRAILAALIAAAGVLVACRIAPPPVSVVPVTADSVHNVPTISPTTAAPQPKGKVAQTTESRPTPRRERSSTLPVANRDTVVAAPAAALEQGPMLPRKEASTPVLVHLDSVAAKGDPLLLIDGVRSTMDDMHRLDPKTIENVEVLKGAAAIAEYGADAQRGVITITTKHAPPP